MLMLPAPNRRRGAADGPGGGQRHQAAPIDCTQTLLSLVWLPIADDELLMAQEVVSLKDPMSGQRMQVGAALTSVV